MVCGDAGWEKLTPYEHCIGGGGRIWPGHLLFLAASHILASLDASQSQRIEYLSFSLPQQRSQGWPEDAKQLTKSLNT